MRTWVLGSNYDKKHVLHKNPWGKGNENAAANSCSPHQAHTSPQGLFKNGKSRTRWSETEEWNKNIIFSNGYCALYFQMATKLLRYQCFFFFSQANYLTGLGGSDGKASACNVGDPGSIPGSGRSPGEGNSNQLQYPCLENSVDWGAW